MRKNQPRRELMIGATGGVAATVVGQASSRVGAAEVGFDLGKPIYKSLKWGMIRHPGSTLEKFRLLKELKYDGVELAPATTTIEWGRRIVDFRAEATVRAIREAMAPTR